MKAQNGQNTENQQNSGKNNLNVIGTPKSEARKSVLPPLNNKSSGNQNLAMSFESPFDRNNQKQASQRSRSRRPSRMEIMAGMVINQNRSRRA